MPDTAPHETESPVESADRAELIRNVSARLGMEDSPFRLEDSLSLTDGGLEAMEAEFKSWTFTLDRSLDAGEKIALSRGMDVPYHLKEKSLTVFTRRQAAALGVFGANGRSLREFILAIG